MPLPTLVSVSVQRHSEMPHLLHLVPDIHLVRVPLISLLPSLTTVLPFAGILRCMLPHPRVLTRCSGGVVRIERDTVTSSLFVRLGRLFIQCCSQSLGHDCTERHHAETCRCRERGLHCVRCWSARACFTVVYVVDVHVGRWEDAGPWYVVCICGARSIGVGMGYEDEWTDMIYWPVS
ncbi:hypothetical protein C8J57DRAFT_1329780 [Mycena rebaudengoi]|nr:hypothetical protein C8J57DRAFT_1329780 [Mycena rebaudengoi]